MQRLVWAAAFAALVLAATSPAGARTDAQRSGELAAPFWDGQEPRLTESEAIAAALAAPKVDDWVDRYPERGLTREATFEEEAGSWTVKVWAPGEAGQIVLAKVEDRSREVTEAWTGPQVAWKMARGYEGAFGRKINEPSIWLAFCAVFLAGLLDVRRPLSARNLDLLVLLSLSVSLWFFNQGDIFTAMPLAYPPLVYLLARTAWIGARGWNGTRRPSAWPVAVLLAATVFLAGFRVGLNIQASNVIDVGYAGVIGAQRIADEGRAPYGNMPEDAGKECGSADAEGYVRDRIQDNGRCESANPRGDTYGPVTYLAYVPGYLGFGWSGKWDELPAAHFTAIVFDLLALAGLGLVGRRFGGPHLGATLAFAWAAYPFTQYASSSNSNDAILPALLVWGFWLVTSAPLRGLFVGLASWSKFAALLVAPLWASYPSGLRRPWRRVAVYAAGFLAATVASFSVLLLEPDPSRAVRVFWDRTFGWQLSRESPFSIWGWNEYPGYPDLAGVQTALKVLLVAAALAVYFVPRVKTPLQLAGLTAALLIGFQLVLTHWFYLYIPWFFPFAAFALLAPTARARAQPPPAPGEEREARTLVAAR